MPINNKQNKSLTAMIKATFTSKKALIIMLLSTVTLIILLISSFEIFYISSKPVGCTLFCHEMRGEYESWKTAMHGEKSNVTCLECHKRAGFGGYFTTGLRALGELASHITSSYIDSYKPGPDDDMLRQSVHKKGNKTFYLRASDSSVEDINVNCQRCHSENYDVVETIKFSVKVSSKSHLERGGSCTDCHRNIVHGNSPDGLNKPTMWTCFTCHDDKKAGRTDCSLCHVKQNEMIQGIGAHGNIISKQSIMSKTVDCKDCHLQKDDYAAPKDGALCTACHKGKEAYGKKLSEWIEEGQSKISRIEGIIEELEFRFREIKKSGRKADDFDEAMKLYVDVRYNAELIKKDGSSGVHNYYYAKDILNATLLRARESRDLLLNGD